MSVVRYRKKPVEVDAIHFDGSHQSVLAVMYFVDAGRGTTELDIYADSDPAKSHITIQTLEGKMRANAGDWIVRGVRGEFHPVRGDIFAETYERVEEATAEAATATPDFFKPGHTYEYAPLHLLFRCDAVGAHPVTGEPSAVGWVRYHGGGWSSGDYSPAEYSDGWVDVTEAGDGRG